MKFFIALCTGILAVTAMPADFNTEYDPARQPHAFTTNPNYTTARIPWGQAGYASMNGGTHGGNGGAVWTVWDPWALRDAVAGNDRREVYIRGRIDLTQLFTGSPGVRIDVGSFKSIYGGDNNAMIFGGGLRLRQVSQVIVQDIRIHNAVNYAQGEQPNGAGGIISMVPGAFSTIDFLGIEVNTEYVWVHHCEFADDPWIAHNTPDNMRRHDGQIDITQGASMVSISNSIFRNHNLVSLVGNSDNNLAQDGNRLKVTWYHNWFQNTVQRNPLVRYGEVHVVNNLYTDVTSYGIGVWTAAQIYAERNSFINTRRAWGWASSPLPSPLGYLLNDNNQLTNSASDSSVSAAGVHWRPSQYYSFGAHHQSQVEAYVRTYAGPRSGPGGLESRTEEPQFPTASALRHSPLLQHCPTKGEPKCPPASKRYRTHDGTCNNVHRPRWGSTLTPVQRFLAPAYWDGLQEPRRARAGALPSAREVSAHVHESRHEESPGITHLLMQWGQFLDHDVTSSSQSRGFNGSVPRCCKNAGKDFVPKELMHPECFPIAVPASDPFYGPRGVRCLEFIRSSPAPRGDCALGWREQLNQVSAYIDGSPLYASSARQSDKLRLFRNGMLQYGRVQQRRPILPAAPERRDELCRGGAVSADCFKSGDARVNEHPGLVAAHIVWLRQHNRMAQELAHLNPHWSDEKIYQESRKIVGAMLQHITYREFLPIVLGSEVMKTFELELQKKGYYSGYSPKINPSPASSFGSAAFRFGHSLVQPSMMRYDRFHRPMHNNVSLHMEMTNPSNIWSKGAVDRLLLGMLNQPIQKRDEFITEELTNHLFQTPAFDFGMDLAAINIQRGRDHGVPPYTAWREPCGLSLIQDFEDLARVMPARAVWKLRQVYRHVDDIDLFTGGMAERPVVGGLVGPTFACIIAQQFLNLRKGDRFWYENGGFESSFTPAQLQQIRRISLAQVLCRTLDTISNIQPFAFLSPEHEGNDRISCHNGLLNNFDLSPWIEIDSENNDVRKSDDDHTTQKPKRTKPTTTKLTTTKPMTTTTKKTSSASKMQPKRPHVNNTTKTTNVTDHKMADNLTDSIIKDDSFDLSIEALTRDNDDRLTVQIDDKLDFKNKTRRNDEGPDIDSRNSRPKNKYGDYDYEDEEIQSVQSVVINNAHNRPYNSNYNNRPSVLTVTENTNKYTYLINYVPRPTEPYRQTTRPTTRRTPERDVVKVTYQTYDDTYRRPNGPNKPYYYNRHEFNDNYRHNRPNTRTTMKDNLQSSARFNDDIDHTTPRPKPTEHTTLNPLRDNNNYKAEPNSDASTSSTTENIYKLVTFGYVGTYKGDMIDDKLVLKTDDKNNKDNIQTINNNDKLQDPISKDFSTYAKSEPDHDDMTDKAKLSTFYAYETATKPYDGQRSTRLNDEDEIDIRTSNKYYYVNNVLHKRPKPDLTVTDQPDKLLDLKKEIIKENYNHPGIPQADAEERSSLDNMPELDKIEPKTSPTKLKVKVKKPSNSPKTPSVAFQVIPSEISPSQWAVYEEDADLPEGLPHRTPAMKADPHALREIPRPITLIGLRRRRPGFF